MDKAKKDHSLRSRNLRPVEYINFTGNEMVGGILSGIHPDDIISLNQLHGDKRGVVRVSMKSEEAAKKLDRKVCDRRLSIKGIKVALVAPTGHFVQVTLLDVPEYVPNSQVEKFMSYYGSIVSIKREYFEYEGRKIENETRQLFFESIKRDFPSKLSMYGHDVFISYRNLVKPTAVRNIPRPQDLQIYGVPKSSSKHSVENPPASKSVSEGKNMKPVTAEYNSSPSISPVHSITPNNTAPSSSARSSITNPVWTPVESNKSGRLNNLSRSKGSIKQTSDSRYKDPTDMAKQSKRESKNLVPTTKGRTEYSRGKVNQSATELKNEEQEIQSKHVRGTELAEKHRHKEDNREDTQCRRDKRVAQRDTEEVYAKTPPRKQKIKRSDTVEELDSTREAEEKVALNVALESMCNPLHNFEISEFNIKSREGMSFGYGRLEVKPSAQAKRNEKQDIEKTTKQYERRVRDGTEDELASHISRDQRPNTSEGKIPKADNRTLTDFDYRETRSLTTSPHPKDHSILDKNEKDFENTQSLVDFNGAQKTEEGQIGRSRVSKKYQTADISSSSLPASFSDPESHDRESVYKDDLVRSLNATPLSITGPENRIDLNYFSSRQWFASDETGQLSHSVRSVLSESQSSDNVKKEEDDADVKQMLDGVEIAGTPYRHPDEVRCTDTYAERLFGPMEKKKVRVKDTRARARVKKQYCLFTS